MSETPKTDAVRALMYEIYEPDNAALDHMLDKYAELERETTRPEALRSGDGMSAGRFHCACVFSRPTDFSEAVLVSECAFHSAKSFDITRYVNAASIGGADCPHEVVEKLQKAIDAASTQAQPTHIDAESFTPMPRTAEAESKWLNGEQNWVEFADKLERELHATNLLRAAAERTIARLSAPSPLAEKS